MSQNYETLVKLVTDVRDDVEKATAGNKAATARVRKSMMEIKNLAQEIRKEMLELRDADKKD
jgi:Histone H1-like protein Hc1